MIVTISNQYGSGGLAAAQRAAGELGYRLIDRELPVVVAKRLHTSPEAVDASEDPSRNLGERLIGGLEMGTPELSLLSPEPASFDRDCLREVQLAVNEFAARGDSVIMGRGAHAILGRRADVLRVFMHAPRDWRIVRISDALHVTREAATAELDRIDRARRAYLRDYYQVEWGDPQCYDLSIDTAHFGIEDSGELIVAAVKACS